MNNNLSLSKTIDQFFQSQLNEAFRGYSSYNQPLVNIGENDEQHFLELAIPGLGKDQVDIELVDKKLTIKAVTNNDQEKKYIKKMFDFSQFQRSFSVPKNADLESIHAKFEAGILTISFNKIIETEISRKIEIQ